MEHNNLDHLSDMQNIELDKLSIWLASNKLDIKNWLITFCDFS